MMKKMYKLRHKRLGLFSPGGSDSVYLHRWTKTGKTWSGTGPLKNHINLLLENWKTNHLPRGNLDFNDVEVVEYEMREVSVKPAHEFVNIIKLLTQ